MKLRLRESALDDIRLIHDRLSLFSHSFADRVEAEVFKTLDMLERFPEFGVATDEPGVHRWPMADLRYTIFYFIASEDHMDVLRVVDSRRVRDVRRMPRA